MNKTQAYNTKHRERYLDELMEFLRIPSVSADPNHAEDMMKAARFVSSQLQQAGADRVEIMATEGHPIVYGERMLSPDLPTVLVYGHYDVQPPDPLDLWHSAPFEPVVKPTEKHPQGAIFARGSSDDKGQVFMHIKAFEAMNKTGELPCNVKFMIEGEEEVGSAHLGPFAAAHKDLLQCDVIVVSDTGIIDNQTPVITVGLRGLSYVEIELTGPNRDLHSGLYGGAVANPINILSEMIAGLVDENRKVTIPGFYNDVLTVSDEERAEMNKAPFELKAYLEDLEIDAPCGETGYTTLERTTIRPSLDANGIWGGYTGKGAKTVLPSKAFAKISMRLVPNQNSEKIAKLFKEYFESIAPDCVKANVTYLHGGEPYVMPIDSEGYQAGYKAMKKTFGKAPIPMRSGGSIPIIPLFEEVLGVKSILLGFGLDSDLIHSPNEHFGLFNFYKGIETIPWFFRYYSELMG